MSIGKKERILGAFYGQALGDAMGMPSELWPRAKVQSFFEWIDDFLAGPEENNAACYFKKAEFTDDTSMAIAVTDAIIECHGKISPQTIAQHIIKWTKEFDAFNKNVLGPTSKIALTALIANKSIDMLENNGLTNGAAMRVTPLGCLLPANNIDNFIQQIALASSPTHKSDIAISGAAVIAYAISKAIDGESWQQIQLALPKVAHVAQYGTITTFSPSMAIRLKLALSIAQEYDKSAIERSDNIYHTIGAGTLSIESVPAAIAMVEIAKTDPNQCATLCANLGGDTDTIGAMATAICGALHGVQTINHHWKIALDEANKIDFSYYSQHLLQFRQDREFSEPR